VYTACLNINTSDGYQQVRLTGEAGWVVTLTVTNVTTPANKYGKISSPITVIRDQTTTFLWVESELTLTAETTDPIALTELKTWAATGSASLSSTTAITTVATITGNTAVITADFYDPYIKLATGGDLPDAVDAYNIAAPGTYKGIVMQVGTYTLDRAVTLPQCVLRGGYASWASRPDTYKTEAGRAVGTLINTAGYDLTFSGAAVTSDSLIEGVQVTAGDNTSGLYAAFGVVSGADPTVRYNTFIGGGGSANNSIGLYVYGGEGAGSSPSVSNCVIKGGTTTATGGRSVGLWTTFNCAPTVADCVISAGTASGSGGKSFGVFNSSYASSPILQRCTIHGGSGATFAAAIWTGEGGRPRIEGNTLSTADAASANYGIYIYSNGRLDTLFGNNIYGCSTALVFDYPHDQKSYASIDDVNADFVTGSQEVNTSAAP
jgi:hypothetical protein